MITSTKMGQKYNTIIVGVIWKIAFWHTFQSCIAVSNDINEDQYPSNIKLNGTDFVDFKSSFPWIEWSNSLIINTSLSEHYH